MGILVCIRYRLHVLHIVIVFLKLYEGFRLVGLGQGGVLIQLMEVFGCVFFYLFGRGEFSVVWV